MECWRSTSQWAEPEIRLSLFVLCSSVQQLWTLIASAEDLAVSLAVLVIRNVLAV